MLPLSNFANRACHDWVDGPAFGIHVLGGTVHPLRSPSQVDKCLRLKVDAQNHQKLTNSLWSYRRISMIYEFAFWNGALFKDNTTDANNRGGEVG
jgi:hypothetical protein